MDNDYSEQKSLSISELIGLDILEKTGSAFAKMTDLSYFSTDELGKQITAPYNLPDYCSLIRSSAKGKKYCQYCVRFSAEQTLIEGITCPVECHAGLYEIAAPIIAGGQLIACMVSGMVSVNAIDDNKIQELAQEYDLDYQQLLEAYKKVHQITQEELDRLGKFLFSLSGILSDMAFGRYMTAKANEELSRVAKLKSDFLANMSHEIRTPMNAVIGMAELALRENISSDARNYINQIKSSGRSLLTIINDILDFSKIESGKIDIIPENYIPLAMFNDVSNIIQTRLHDKNVELILDVDPKLPYELYGDSQRIRQILINILNNAAKFTHSGQVKISVNFSSLDSDDEELEGIDDDTSFFENNDILITEADLDAFILQRDKKEKKNQLESSQSILMEICVEDTGIGIKKDDLGKIFNAFQQVDSKRNRNIEGTGLGLSISKRLVSIMNGTIGVESEYGVGSKFFFSIPQKITRNEPSVKVKEAQKLVVAGLFKNQYVQNQFKKDVTLLRISNCVIPNANNLKAKIEKLLLLAKGREVYLFIEEPVFTPEVCSILQSFKSVNIVLIIDFFTNKHYDDMEVMILKKPLSVLSISSLLNKENVTVLDNHLDDVVLDFGFTAPNANVLIVDDNVINLTVAEGLLEPLNMKISTATSGAIAIEKCKQQEFDIVFMDHMMPEMDGVEATHLLRKLPGYETRPVIALTANVVGGAKEMFLSEGFSDFIPKPIELKTMTNKVRKWLTPSLIQNKIPGSTETSVNNKKLLVADLDTRYALELLGSKDLFWKILKEYHKNINKKCDLIVQCFQAKDWKRYTIEVHALKSSSRQIGATLLSDKAAELEQAGINNNIELIKEKTPSLLEKYISYVDILQPFFENELGSDNNENQSTQEKIEIDKNQLKEKLSTIATAATDLDSDTVDSLLQELQSYNFTKEESKLLQQIKEASENFDSETVCQKVEEWIENLG